MNQELPQGWALAALGEIGDINPRHPTNLSDDTFVSFAPMPALSTDRPEFESLQERPFGEVRKGFTHFAEGDVLFAKITPCMENGKGAVAVGLSNGLGCGTTEIHVVRPLGRIVPHYIYHYLHQPSIRRQAEANFTGSAGQARVPVRFIKDLEIPLPPLAEQKRIVAKLEVLLGKVDACRKRLEKIPVILKRFRQSVLAAACSGRLTADWREKVGSDESAATWVRHAQEERSREFQHKRLEAQRNNQRRPKAPKNEFHAQVDKGADGLPDQWCATRIGDISDCLDNIRIPINKSARSRRQGNIPYYGANGQVGWIDDYLFDEELVLVVEDETFIGRDKPFSYIIRGKAWVNNHAHVLRPVGGMPVGYLNICLSCYDFIPLTSGTTGRRKLNQEALLDATLWVAPHSEQHEIVRRVEALFALADQIETRYAKAKTHVDRLTQSILAKAFRGDLVPQDPNDEPASALLERIRLQRQDASVARKQPRRKGVSAADTVGIR